MPKRFSPTQVQKFSEKSVMLESERLIFRKITEADFDDLAEMLRNPEVMTAWEHTFSDDEIQKWIESKYYGIKTILWAISPPYAKISEYSSGKWG